MLTPTSSQEENGLIRRSAAVRRRWSLIEILRYRGANFYELADLFGRLHGTFDMLGNLLEHLHSLHPVQSGEAKLVAEIGSVEEFTKLRPLLQEVDMELAIDSLDRLIGKVCRSPNKFRSQKSKKR